MRIVVCLKEVIETSLNLGYGQVSETLMQKGFAFGLNPNDAQALGEALRFKEEDTSVEITLVSLGPKGWKIT